jgi:predicted transcriptional regulator
MKRNTQQLIIDMLKAVYYAPHGLKASQIMQKANVPNSSSAPLLAKLTAKGYLNRQLVGSRYVYTVTQKALNLLHCYRTFETLYHDLV